MGMGMDKGKGKEMNYARALLKLKTFQMPLANIF
jgi:hypothetical protein